MAERAPCPKLPGRVHLPTGRVVRLSLSAEPEPDFDCTESSRAGRSAGEATSPRKPSFRERSEPEPDAGGLFRDALRAFRTSVRVADERGTPIDVGALALSDFHALRAIATRAGLLQEAEVDATCDNCGQAVRVRPSSALELGPFVDGELDDPELDRPFAFGAPRPIAPMRVGRARASTVTLADRTVDEATALFAALARPTVRITSAVVAAMGVVALGDERRAPVLARALAGASDEAFDAVVARFDEAHYRARLTVRVRCPGCGAKQPVDAPASREFPADFTRTRGDVGQSAPFPTIDAFEARAFEIGDEVYRARQVGAVELVVDDDVPEVDGGGVPLLGCYTPGGVDPATHVATSPEVRLFYRTFCAMWTDDGPYDVDAEIRETIDHELAHHLAHLEGDDPQDDEERAEIVNDELRVVGRRESARRARAGLAADVAEFVRRTWLVWLVALVFVLLSVLADR